jgi:hypothetical protein
MAVTLNANTSTGFIATSDTSTILQLQTAGTTALTVDASQNVGIGTASPLSQSKLTVAQDGATTAGGLTVDQTNGSSNRAGGIFLARQTDNRASIESDYFNGLIFSNKSGTGSLTERMRIPVLGGIQSVSSISVGNTAPTTSGAGITFPATQSASSDVNTLDDYEEGTFTPTLGGTSTYAQQAGNYKKVGGLVYVSGILQVTTLGTGSTSQMSGFPFTCSVGPRNTLAIGYWSGTVGSLAYLAFYVPAGSASTNTIATTAVASTVQDGYGVFQSGTYVIFSGCYHAS